MEFGKDIMSVGMYMETNELFEGRNSLRIYHRFLAVLCILCQSVFAAIIFLEYNTNILSIIQPEAESEDTMKQYEEIYCFEGIGDKPAEDVFNKIAKKGTVAD